MGQAKLYGQKSTGMSINGIIKDYYVYAGENIKAGDLVEFINGLAMKKDYGESVDTPISTTTNSTYRSLSAVLLDDSRVLLIYGSAEMRACVVTVDNATIKIGIDTQIANETVYGYSPVLLPNGNVFLAYYTDLDSSYGLYGLVLTISGNAIVTGLKTLLSDFIYYATGLGEGLSVTLLPSGNVFVPFAYNSNTYLYALVVSINGTDISVGTKQSLSSYQLSGRVTSTTLLQNGNVFVAHHYEATNYLLYGIVCAVSGTTITGGSDTSIDTTKYSGYRISAVSLDNNKVFIAHSYTTSYYLHAIVCTVSGTSITKGTTVGNGVVQTAWLAISATKINDQNVLVTHTNGNNSAGAPLNRILYGCIYTIDGTTITFGTDTQLSSADYSGYEISSLLLNNGTIFIAHSYSSNYHLYAQIFGIDYDNNIPTNHIIISEYETQVRKVTTGQFYGVAKTSGVGAPEYVEVEVEKEVTKTGNIFPTTWTATDRLHATSSDGYEIKANSSSNTTDYAYYVSDGNTNTSISSKSVTTSNYSWQITMTCPKPTKITKMKTYIYTNGSNFSIRGSMDNSTWTTLYSTTSSQTSLSEIILDKTDFYSYYRINCTVVTDGVATVREWQTSEYVEVEKEIQQIPSTEHKDKVSIYQSTNSFNIIPDNSFENDKWNDINYSSDASHSGKRSLYFPTGTTYVPNIEIARPIVGHKYYGRRYIKTNGNNQPADCRFEVWGADGANMNWVYAWNNGNYPDWGFDSAIHEIAGVDYPETDRTIIRCFNVNTTADTWVDDLLLIDLTEVFGAGKEPTKEWCDANL